LWQYGFAWGRFQSSILAYGWFLVSEILAAVFVGYIIGKIAKGAELFNAMASRPDLGQTFLWQ
jgi:hypothetical protein